MAIADNVTLLEYETLARPAAGGIAAFKQADFDWLVRSPLVEKHIFEIITPDLVRATNWVGVVRCPSGCQLEILPKVADRDQIAQARRTVIRMLRRSLKLNRDTEQTADLHLFELPLLEWVMEAFLEALGRLLRRGLRSSYQEIEEEAPWLRGRLLLAEAARRPPSRLHLFPQRRAEFSLNRPENRAIKAALRLVQRHVQGPRSWSQAREYWEWLDPVEESRDWKTDLGRWDRGPLMQDYRDIRLLTTFILLGRLPFSQAGEAQGYAWVFPMEKLFEQHVAACLVDWLGGEGTIKSQALTDCLLTLDGDGVGRMRPDLILECGTDRWVLDTKWKQIGVNGNAPLSEVAEADLYQLNAYAETFAEGAGQAVLIYPSWAGFQAPVGPLTFRPSGKQLWIAPFDLDSDRLGLERGLFSPLAKAV